MTQANTLIASAAVIALTLGITSRADTPTETETPLPLGSMIIAAGDDAAPAAKTEDNAEDSAKMGEEEGTHEGANLGATPENDTDKIDQPARRNPTTGASAADQTGAH
jgi:hypothetical protein